MTIPSADKLLLIFLASSSVCPVAPVLPICAGGSKGVRQLLQDERERLAGLTFSEPARSTR